MVIADHVIRGRPLTVLAVVFYCVALGAGIAMVDLDVFTKVARQAKHFTPWAKTTQIMPMPKDTPPPPSPKSE